MKVVLIRHALTTSGKVKFRAAARGLARIVPRPGALLTSPLPRALATADIAAQAFTGVVPAVEPALADDSVDDVVTALKAHPLDATVAVVGHEPLLGALLARMLGASQAERLAFKKGGAAVVDLPDGPASPGRLVWFLDPHVLRTLADRPGTSSGARKEPRS